MNRGHGRERGTAKKKPAPKYIGARGWSVKLLISDGHRPRHRVRLHHHRHAIHHHRHRGSHHLHRCCRDSRHRHYSCGEQNNHAGLSCRNVALSSPDFRCTTGHCRNEAPNNHGCCCKKVDCKNGCRRYKKMAAGSRYCVDTHRCSRFLRRADDSRNSCARRSPNWSDD